MLKGKAEPNISAGKHGSALQAAALKSSVEIIYKFLKHRASLDVRSGKYGGPLVAAVMRDYHSWSGDLDIRQHLLQKDFAPKAYLDALEKAFKLRLLKETFRLVWESAQSKGNNKLPLTSKKLLAYFKHTERQRQPKDLEEENDSSYFEDVWESDWEDYEYDKSECDKLEADEFEGDELEEKEKLHKPLEKLSGDVSRSRQVKGSTYGASGYALPIQSATNGNSLAVGEYRGESRGHSDGGLHRPIPRHARSPIWEFGAPPL